MNKPNVGTVFHHRETGKPALCVTPYDGEWQNNDGRILFRIRHFSDIPSLPISVFTSLRIPIEIVKGQGKRGLDSYLSAFFMNGWFDEKDKEKKDAIKKAAREAKNDYWLFFLPSGFPDRYIEGIGQYDEYGNFIGKEKVNSQRN